jgi:hypothetical protein
VDVHEKNLHQNIITKTYHNMCRRKLSFAASLCFLTLIMISCLPVTDKKVASLSGKSERKQAFTPKPFRVLLIIGDQWTDPLSYNIDFRRVKGEEFIDVVTMLKIWGVPFDILRLDEQRLQINRFLDGEAKPNYGCIIWMADPDKLKGYSANYETLKRAVEEYGISMITLFDNIKTPEVAGLSGINYIRTSNIILGRNREKFLITGNHFITSEANGTSLPDRTLKNVSGVPAANGITPEPEDTGEDPESISLVSCTVKDSVRVLASIGTTPQMIVRDVSDETKVVWIGGGKEWFRKYPVMRKIFRKALVCCIGYGIFNDTFANGYIFIMDDVGCSEHAWSLRWHYPTPAKDTLIKYLIEPLERNGLMMVQNITPGFADPEKKIIVPPWSVRPFTDIFGNRQDYGSTKEGLDEGIRRGVFEIQPHRAWSHMNWDLDSPPGPWWGSPVGGELAVTDWYNEIVDVRRGRKPVPSNDLLFIYKTGIDAIKKAFGIVPLAAEVRTGAEVTNDSNGGDDIGRIAAIAGLGVSRECYVGIDRTIEFSMMMPEQFTCHDLDLTAKTDNPADQTEAGWDNLLKMTTEELLRSKIAGGRRINLHDNLNWIESKKNKYWMGFNETCAYLHSQISGSGENGLAVELYYDDHYCKYFEKKPSRWTLELSDELMEKLDSEALVLVDGQSANIKPAPRQIITIPPGTGKHKIELAAR